VWQLLGHKRALAKTPYASVLFGDTPEATLKVAQSIRTSGFHAAKFGWGPYGHGTVAADADLVHAAREGLGPDAQLMVDAGTAFGQDVDAAALRLPALQEVTATWLEEPFVADATDSYARLAAQSAVSIAGGEGSHSALGAINFIEHSAVRFIQIDAGRIGGISPAIEVFRHADRKRITYVNHTFTSHLALAASMAPFAGGADHHLCEYPTQAQPLAQVLGRPVITRNNAGTIQLPDTPGLGVGVNTAALIPYLVDVDIKVAGKTLYKTPTL